jgi:chromosomal replication initiation ATPase DnaA
VRSIEVTDDEAELLAVLRERPGAESESKLVARIAYDHGMTVEKLLARSRASSVVAAKLCLYRALRAHGLSFPEIGKLLGRNQSTIQKAFARSLARRERSR